MNVVDRKPDDGTAYGMKPSSSLKELTEVGQRTPMGELLRRYWHPVALSTDATDTPKAIRVLGEDLILFRDRQGRPGLLHNRCCHRGTTLYYGRVEEQGIRCCYHGWLFDVEGHCVEQPCEPEGGLHKDKARQPWYPVREQHGLIFAYMGPPEKKPVLPRYEILEVLDADEEIVPDGTSIGGGGPVVIPCNWMQHYDNLPDTYHVMILHTLFSGVQFTEMMGQMPEVDWATTERGVSTITARKQPDGRVFHRISEAVLPTLRIIPDPLVGQYARCESIGWVLPIDDTSFCIYTATRQRKTQADFRARSRPRPNGKRWAEMSDAERRDFPGDYEAQVGQSPITFHSDEHLATTDRGMVMLRRLFMKQLEAIAAGGDPINVSFDENAPPIKFEAGNFME